MASSVTLHPSSALDAGCAMGFLVEALASAASTPTASTSPSTRSRRSTSRSASHCIGRLAGRAADAPLRPDRLHRGARAPAGRARPRARSPTSAPATDRILLSTTPDDYGEATHLNVQPPEDWAARCSPERGSSATSTTTSPTSPPGRRSTPAPRSRCRRRPPLRPLPGGDAPEVRGPRSAARRPGAAGRDRGRAGIENRPELQAELDRLQRGVLRLRDLLIGKDAELGAARGQVRCAEDRQRTPTSSERHRVGFCSVRVVADPPRRLRLRPRVGPGWPRPASRSSRRSTRPRPTSCGRCWSSVRHQTFGDWELCLVDDASGAARARDRSTRPSARTPASGSERRAENGGIVAASNDALAMARGEFVALLDHDDELHPDALAHVDEALDADPEADYVYTDEDKIDRAGRHSGPFFKPDWSPERMRTQMYTCHLSVLRRSLVEEVGGFDPEFEGSQDWDLVLKVTERARAVVHVPRVLYHWRMLETSAAGGGEAAKPWAFEAGKRAVQAHCERIGLQARVERDPADRRRLPPRAGAAARAAGQHRHPDRRPGARGPLRAGRPRQQLRPQHRRDVDLRELRDRLRRRRVDRPGGCSTSCGRSPATGCGSSPTTGPSTSRPRSTLGAVRSEGEHLLLLNDDIEVIDPGLARADGHVLGAPGDRRRRRPAALGRRAPPARRRRLRERRLPGHPYRGFPGDFRATRTASRSPATASR